MYEEKKKILPHPGKRQKKIIQLTHRVPIRGAMPGFFLRGYSLAGALIPLYLRNGISTSAPEHIGVQARCVPARRFRVSAGACSVVHAPARRAATAATKILRLNRLARNPASPGSGSMFKTKRPTSFSDGTSGTASERNQRSRRANHKAEPPAKRKLASPLPIRLV